MTTIASIRQHFPPGLAERFEPLQRLGAGGMGVVWEVRDTRDDRRAALKLLFSSADDRAWERLRREAEVLANLEHPNIVRLYEAHVEDPPYLLMERVDGVPLSMLTREVDLVDLSRQLAAGLAELHDRGLVHRDLKPANVLVTDDDRVVLIDFGLVFDPARTALTDGVGVLGTLPFIAPERLRGGPASPASDWYAWGVSLFLMLEGNLPYTRAQIWDTARGLPLPSPLFASTAPGDPLHALVSSCLAEDPDRRPASGLEIDAMLERAGALPRARRVPSTQCQAVLAPADSPGEGAPRAAAQPVVMRAVPGPGRAAADIPAAPVTPCAGCDVDVALDPTRECPVCRRPSHVHCWRLAEGCGDPRCRGSDADFRARVLGSIAPETVSGARPGAPAGPPGRLSAESLRNLALLAVLGGVLAAVAAGFLWPGGAARAALAVGLLLVTGGFLVYAAAESLAGLAAGGTSRRRDWLERASLVQLEQARREAPRDVAIVGRLADIRRAQGDAKTAWATYEQALALASARADLRVGKARALIACDRADDAARELQRAQRDGAGTAAGEQASFWLQVLERRGRRR